MALDEAEMTLDVRSVPKPEAWRQLTQHTEAVLQGVDDEVCAMATISCLVHHGFGHVWTGFSRVVTPGQLLRVGPYQGTLGCLEIAFGTRAAERALDAIQDTVPDLAPAATPAKEATATEPS